MELIHEIEADGKSHVSALAFSADGKRLFSSGFDATVKIWQVDAKRNFKLSKTLAGHKNCANAFAFPGNGKLLLSASSDGTIREWKLPSGVPGTVLQAHRKPVFALKVFASGGDEMIATSSYDGTIRFWRPSGSPAGRSYESVGLVKGKGRETGSLLFRAKGKELITAGWGADITIWSVPDGELLNRIPHGSKGLFSMREFTAGKILCVGYDGTVRVFTPKTGELSELFRVKDKGYYGTAIAPGNRRGAVCVDHGVVLYDLKKGEPIAREKIKPRSVSSPTFSPDGKMLLTACADKKFRVFEV